MQSVTLWLLSHVRHNLLVGFPEYHPIIPVLPVYLFRASAILNTSINKSLVQQIVSPATLHFYHTNIWCQDKLENPHSHLN